MAIAVLPSTAAAPSEWYASILMPDPTYPTTGTSQGEAYGTFGFTGNGLNRFVIPLDAGMTGSAVLLRGDPGVMGTCDLDMWFYDSNGNEVAADIEEFGCDEYTIAPAGAASLVTVLAMGFNVEFTVHIS